MAKARTAQKKRKTRPYKVWTPTDLKSLRQYARDMVPVRKIAKAMRRTEATIRMKAYQLGFSVGHRRRSASKTRR
jgi:hypothetical protein